MDIRINGETKCVQQGLTVQQLLLEMSIDPSQPGIAVALDLEVIPRKRWGELQIPPTSEIEIIHAVQGG
ncbi:MAG: sulfur carrier protein ThiS [Candidatus Poribacteria bacterium]|nr:sulfur carrier protein ThiS [Candidatus Poribacteria bacterium]MDE0505265.1 sulfur carrier protein ThiS [Candidatus Poribacteria bacterium]